MGILSTSTDSINFFSAVLPALLMYVVVIVGMWKLFVKAGEPGWGVIIPFYNMYILYKIAWGKGWFFLFLMIPCVGAIVQIIMSLKLAKAYGKGTAFALGLVFFPAIFYLILGFGAAEYQGPQ